MGLDRYLPWPVILGWLSWLYELLASPTSGLKGLAESLITNMTGVFWAMVIIYGSTYVGMEIIGYVITAIVAFFMCIQAKQAWLAYIPGTSLAHARLLLQTAIGNLCAIADFRWRVWLPNESNRSLVACEISRYFFARRTSTVVNPRSYLYPLCIETYPGQYS